MGAIERTSAQVVIVGGSVAGCTAAVLLARQGVSVVLVERADGAGHHKRSCTHFIQRGAQPAIDRLGITDRIVAAGAVPNRTHVWTRWGWYENAGHTGWNLQRRTLDPLLRELVIAEPTITFMRGVLVTDVVSDGDGRPRGVRGRRPDGTRIEVDAQVVVAADGRASTVAKLADVHGRTTPHGRILYFGHFTGVDITAEGDSFLWLRDPAVNYAFANDGGVSVIGCMVPPGRLDEFRADPHHALLGTFDGLAGAPDLAGARSVGPIRGVVDMHSVRRAPTRPGLALVGDAAQTNDPMWGVGIGLAFQTAALLADAIGPVVGRGDRRVNRALRTYGRRHRNLLLGHHLLMRDHATGRPLRRVERLLFSTAPHHPPTAAMLAELATRDRPAHRTLTPCRLFRTATVAIGRATQGMTASAADASHDSTVFAVARSASATATISASDQEVSI